MAMDIVDEVIEMIVDNIVDNYRVIKVPESRKRVVLEANLTIDPNTQYLSGAKGELIIFANKESAAAIAQALSLNLKLSKQT